MRIIRRFPALTFIAASFLISYGVGIAAHLLLQRLQKTLGSNLGNINDIVMRFGPSLAGLLMACLISGKQGAKGLVARLVSGRLSAGVLIAVVCVPPALTLATFWLRGYGGELSSVILAAAPGVFVTQLGLASITAGLGEELGWRGFMLPCLAERHSPLAASFLVAIGWLVWHLPAFLLADKGASDPFLPFMIVVVPLSIVLTWSYYASKEGLLAPVLLHGSLNASFYSMEQLFPQVTQAAGFQPGFDWVLTALWCVLGLLVVVRFQQQLGRNERELLRV
ncbi:MAG: CPBP family intramembrane glutamic endopeptidase [Acidobacteriota bacterium]